MAPPKKLDRRTSPTQQTPENASSGSANAGVGISSESVQSLLKAVEVLVLAAIYSPVSLLNLSPVYGSIPPSVYHARMTMAAVMFAWTAKSTLRSFLLRHVAKYLPLLAYSIPTIQYYLFTYSGQLGPVYGPLLTELLTYFPLTALSVVSAAALLETIDLGQYGGRFKDVGTGLISYMILGATAKASKSIIERNIGSSFILTRSGLQLVLASFYALLLPSKVLLFTLLPILHSVLFNIHVPHSTTSLALNSTLQAHNFSLVARQESLTGYISVLDNFEHGFRVMRCDHSLLGGEWTTPSMSYRPRIKEPIYAVFAMLEAVRLVETKATKKSHIPDNQAKALVMYGFSKLHK